MKIVQVLILTVAAAGATPRDEDRRIPFLHGSVVDSQRHLSPVIANGKTFDATQCLDESIIEILEATGAPGASFAVLKRGKVAYEQGYGLRDAPNVGSNESRPVLPSTPFRIGSVSKPITATIVVLLAQEGLLELDSVVFGDTGVLAKFAQQHPPVDPRVNNITIRQLLHHSSGFTAEINVDDQPADPSDSSRFVSESLGIAGPALCQDLMQFMMTLPLAYEPDTEEWYSNFGYCVLGRVIEAVTNMSYVEAARKWLLDPAGVDPTEMYLGATRLEDIPSNEAEYYDPNNTIPCTGPSLYPSDGGTIVLCPYGSAFVMEALDSDGGWVASARQLIKILTVVSAPHCNDDECLVKPAWRDEIEKRPSFVPSNETFWRGLGWSIRSIDDGGVTWSKTGSLLGTFSFWVRMTEEDGYGYAIILNAYDPAIQDLYCGDVGLDGWLSNLAKCVNASAWPVEYFEEQAGGPTSAGTPTITPTSEGTPLFGTMLTFLVAVLVTTAFMV